MPALFVAVLILSLNPPVWSQQASIKRLQEDADLLDGIPAEAQKRPDYQERSQKRVRDCCDASLGGVVRTLLRF